jgi:hypothetical protein
MTDLMTLKEFESPEAAVERDWWSYDYLNCKIFLAYRVTENLRCSRSAFEQQRKNYERV